MRLTTKEILYWLSRFAQELHAQRDYLTELDSAIGDADHGSNMDRGFQAVNTQITGMGDADIGTIFKTVGMTLVSTVGGASGPLYGTIFLRAGMKTAGKQELNEDDVVMVLEGALEGLQTRGKAHPGEKTMLDAFAPAEEAAQAAQAQHLGMRQLLDNTRDAAEKGMRATIPMLATKGRASYLGERSIGHQDPGATSCWLLFKTLAETCM